MSDNVELKNIYYRINMSGPRLDARLLSDLANFNWVTIEYFQIEDCMDIVLRLNAESEFILFESKLSNVEAKKMITEVHEAMKQSKILMHDREFLEYFKKLKL